MNRTKTIYRTPRTAYRTPLTACILIAVFGLLPFFTLAQTIPSTLFGTYIGDAHIKSDLLAIDDTIPGVPVEFKKTNSEKDYILTIPGLGGSGMGIPEEIDYVIVTPTANGYKLSRANPVTFIIDTLTVPPIPPYFPGGTFTNVPVKIALGNTTIVDYVLDLNIMVSATIAVMGFPITIPIDIHFNGTLFSPPVIITTELPAGKVSEPYLAALEANGLPPITWDIDEDTPLPPGLMLDKITGVISGIPTDSGSFEFTVIAFNTANYDIKTLRIEIKSEDEIDTVGICCQNIIEFQIYPNPTSGELRVLIPDIRYPICDIVIYDMLGRIQKIDNWKSEIGKSEINISHMPAGIYFVRINTENRTIVRKILKM